jgi:hypothetical protein
VKNKSFKDLLKSISQMRTQHKEDLFSSKEAKILWKKSDDAIRTGRMLSEIYDKVPKKFKNVSIDIMELYVIRAPKEIKKAVLKWLGEE